MRDCPNCGEQHEEAFESCWRCGAPLVLDSDPADEEKGSSEEMTPILQIPPLELSVEEDELGTLDEPASKSCPSCGEQHGGDFEACWKCDTPLIAAGDATQDLARVPERELSDKGSEFADEADDQGGDAGFAGARPKVCPNCGEFHDGVFEACWRCGTALPTDSWEADESSSSPAIAPQIGGGAPRDTPRPNGDPRGDLKACSRCGHTLRELAHFCVQCGCRLS